MNFSKIWAAMLLASSVSSAQEPKISTLSIPVEKGGEFIPPKAILVEESSKVPAEQKKETLEVQSKMANKVREIHASEPTPAPAKPLEASTYVPFGTPVAWRPGFVNSPFAKPNQFVDVTGLPAGMEVKCPYTGKLFRVPAVVDTQLTDAQPKQVEAIQTLQELGGIQTVLMNQLTRNSGDQKEMLQIIKALYDVTEKILGLKEKEKNEKPKQ